MDRNVPAPPGLLLLGTSHVGKSSCARLIGEALGWTVQSTDALARHPGRPWMGVPDPVIAFYTGLDDDTVHWFLQVHHANVRPIIEAQVAALRRSGDGFVLEGSALRPDHLAGLELGGAVAVCLQIDPAALRNRIETASRRAQQPDRMHVAIDRFTERSVRDNAAVVDLADQYGLARLDVTDIPNVKDLAAKVQRVAGL